MTRATLTARLEKNWHLIALAGTIAGAFGYKWVSPDQRMATIEQAAKVTNDRLDAAVLRLDRVETAVTILALKACGDTSVGGYESLQLKCAELRQR